MTKGAAITRMQVKIVTDSTASLPPALTAELGITVVPLTIHFGSRTFVDGVEPPGRFYEYLRSEPTPPSTSTPSPGDFFRTFEELLADGSCVISIHIMATKSATLRAAQLAAEMLPPGRVFVVDSQSLSLGLGQMVLEAARMAREGLPAAVILAHLDQLIPGADAFATLRSLNQLRRSGRVSLGRALVAGLLAIKPVIYGGGGVMEVVDKARGFPAAVNLMVEHAAAKAAGHRVRLAVVHTNAPEGAEELLGRIRPRFDCTAVMVAEAGPTLATHVGEGALGVMTLRLGRI